ncbi:MAG: oligosaccharide flippase family protein [Lachnospiraceae bacterium]|nr:oligosaccharide flippase family protein [Lachnospiraceae bacterium]
MADKVVGKRLLLKSGFWYVASMFLTKGMVFITMPIFTRLMTKAQYGDFSVFCSWQSVLIIFCSLEIHGTLNLARFDYSEEEYKSYITSSLCLSTLIAGVLFGLYLAFPHMFDKLFLMKKEYMYVMFAYLFTVPAIYMFQTKQRVEYKYKVSSTISLGASILAPIIALVMVLLMKDSDPLFGRIIGQHVLYIALGVAFYIYFLHCSRTIRVSYWKYAIRLGLPLVFSYIGSRVLLTADTIILKHMCTPENVSNVSVTHSTSQIILLLVQTINMAWAPWLYDMLKTRRHKDVKKFYRVYLWAVVLATFAALAIGPEIIHILGGQKYKDAIYLLPPNILCGIFTVLTATFVNIETYNKKPRYAAILTGGVAALNVVLDILGVYLFGYMAVCYATVLCLLLLCVLHYRVTLKMEIKEILSAKTFAAVLIAAIMLIPTALLLYQNTVVRYSVIAVCFLVVVAIAIYKREEIKHLIKKVRKKK